MRELRLIAEHKPRYNRRSRFPERVHLGQAHRRALAAAVHGPPGARRRRRLPRAVRAPSAPPSGPWPRCTRRFPIRQCSDRLPQRPDAQRLRAGRDGPVPVAVRRQRSDRRLRRRGRAGCASRLIATPDAVVEALRRRMAALAARRAVRGSRLRYRDRLAAFLRGAARTQRLSALTRCAEVVAARREDDGGWEVHVVRHGRLAAAGVDPARRRRRGQWVDAAAAPAPRRCCPARPDAGRDRRGDREDAALAGVRRASGWSHVDGEWTLSRSAAPPGTWRSTTRSRQSRTVAGPVRRASTPATRAPTGALRPAAVRVSTASEAP